MDVSGLIVQLLNGLAGASSLFLVAAGLSLIFGVTRIVNFAHGSFFMLGIYLAYSLVEHLGRKLGLAWSFWLLLLLAAVISGVLGALVEIVLLRRIYKAPELFQLLATFALVLVIKDAALWVWGPEDLLGPRAPGLAGSIDILGRRFPSYDLLLMVIGPVILGLLWLLLTRTRFGTLVRAATQDREMVGALGIHQSWLFTGVFALGCALAGLGGALQLPREPANLGLDLLTIGDAFVVVVVGGMGSLTGAFLASILIGLLQTYAVAVDLSILDVLRQLGITLSTSAQNNSVAKLTVSQIAPILPYLMLVLILIFRPKGLLGTREG